MIRIVVFSLLLTLLSFSALAAKDASFEVLCKSLPEYQPGSGAQGAEYIPGVDVKGRLVAPADLNASMAAGIDVINVPVSIDLIQRFALNVPQGLELKPDVAAISIHKDGRVTYNDQDLTRRAYSVCAKNGRVPLEGTRPVQQDKQVLQPPAAQKPPTKIYDLPVEPKLAVPKDSKAQ
jgi:hypothetical protein